MRQQFPLPVTIKCDIINFDIDELRADYVPFSSCETLSYTWGDAADRISNKLDGHNFEVTSNLAAALRRRLRSEEGYRYAWVNAICIN